MIQYILNHWTDDPEVMESTLNEIICTLHAVVK